MRVTRLLLISRPMLWPVAPVMFLLGLKLGPGLQLLGTSTVLFMLFALAIPFSLAGYGLNDIYDMASDRANKRKGLLEGVILAPAEVPAVRTAVIVSIIILLVAAAMTGLLINMLIMAAVVTIGVLYSVPPVRLKERPPFDSISNGVLYCYGPFLLGYSFGPWSAAVMYKMVLLGMAAIAVHMYGTILDYSPDLRAGHRTFAVKYGRRTTAVIAAATVLGTALLAQFTSATINTYLVIVALAIFSTALVAAETIERFAKWVIRSILASFLVLAMLFI